MKTIFPLITVGSFAMAAAPLCGRAATAGADLAANEKPDGPQELVNPNPTVPEWSYGYRPAVLSPDLTLFTPAEHTNSFVGPNDAMEGFNVANGVSVPAVVVNTDAAPVMLHYGAGPVNPSEMLMHGMTTDFAVVRYTIPTAGTYSGSASFRAIHSGDADVHVVLNGNTELFSQVLLPGESAAPLFPNTVLAAGNTVDFVVGINGTLGGDSVAFDAVIIPEPAGAALACVGAGSLLLRRRRA